MGGSVIVAGLAGTFLMTIFVELVCVIFKKPFHVVRILAQVLRLNSAPDKQNRTMYGIAVLVHYSIGILFTYGFKLCIEREFLEPSLRDTLVFGAIAGLIGIAGWRIAFAVHPATPQLNLTQYLTVIWLGHLIFALGQFYAQVIL